MGIPRGIRNNNPLNIRHDKDRWQGEIIPSHDYSFKQFQTIEWGYRAAFKLLRNYQRLHGCETLDDFIHRWAPPVENDTRGYIRMVAKRSGLEDISRVDTTNGEMMCRIVSAMHYVECGEEADVDEVRRGWELFLSNP